METTQDLSCDHLEVRLAETPQEVDAAQALRFRVFYQEGGAIASEETARLERDADAYDEVCDHLLVVDKSKPTLETSIIGTYRLMRREHADKIGGFYTSGEYDISGLLALPMPILELGRSCTHPDYRNRSTMQLLWQGIAGYVFRHDIGMMFGCASLKGTNPQDLGVQLSYLYHHHLAPADIRPKALPELFTPMNFLSESELNPKRALASLPPLLKGYLRLGGFVGDGAVVDEQFNTTDVCIMVKTDAVTGKYLRHYDRTARDPSA